jgi:hypothetical protein
MVPPGSTLQLANRPLSRAETRPSATPAPLMRSPRCRCRCSGPPRAAPPPGAPCALLCCCSGAGTGTPPGGRPRRARGSAPGRAGRRRGCRGGGRGAAFSAHCPGLPVCQGSSGEGGQQGRLPLLREAAVSAGSSLAPCWRQQRPWSTHPMAPMMESTWLPDAAPPLPAQRPPGAHGAQQPTRPAAQRREQQCRAQAGESSGAHLLRCCSPRPPPPAGCQRPGPPRIDQS